MKKRRTANLGRSKVSNGQMVETKGFRCTKCSQVLSNAANLGRHYRNVHNYEAPKLRLKCAYCSRIFCSTEGKTNHENWHMKQAMLRDKFQAMKCSHCPAMFTFEQDKVNHEKEHLNNATTRVDKTKPIVWNCSYCPDTFKAEASKIVHEKKHVEKAKVSKKTTLWKCARCPSIFKRELDKFNHERRVHSGRNSFVCNLCGGSFNKLISLEWHQHVHHWDDEKPGAGVKSATVEKKNIETVAVKKKVVKARAVVGKRKRVKREPVTARTKNGIVMVYANKLTCSYCPKFLADSTSKLRHERRHTGEHLYRCKFCSMTFVRIERQNKHQLECRHLDAMSFCKFCDYHTLIRSQLANHYQRSHGFTFKSDIELEFYRREILAGCNQTSQIVPESSKQNGVERSNEDELTKNEDDPSSESNDDDPSPELNEDDVSSESNDDDSSSESDDDSSSESNESSIFESSFEQFQATGPVKDHEMQVSTENNLPSNGSSGFSQTTQVKDTNQPGACFSQITNQLEEMFRDHDSNPHQSAESSSSMSEKLTETEAERRICESEVPARSNDELREVLQDNVTNQSQTQSVAGAGGCLGEQANPYSGISIKSEIICTYSEAVSEPGTEMEQDPPDEKLIKYEVEVAQINNNLRQIFQADQVAENCANFDWQVEQNSSCRVVDLTNEDNDDEVEGPIIIIDDDDN